MNKSWLKLVCTSFVVVLSVQITSALPPYDKAWKAKYLDKGVPADFREAAEAARCNICHAAPIPPKKIAYNSYGDAVGMFLKKNVLAELKDDALTQAITSGLERAEAQRSANGKTFGELIKDGHLPGN